MVLPRRRDEIHQTVEELKRREFDQAVRVGPRGLPPAPRADPGLPPVYSAGMRTF